MLSDDITRTVNEGVGTVAGVMNAAARGAIMFGILALATVAIAVAIPAVLGASSVMGGIGLFFGALPAAAAGAGWTAAGIGAMTGAALMGVSRLIPGSKEGFGFKHQPPVTSSAAGMQDAAHLHAQQRAAYAATGQDNPYYRDGLGAELATRGSGAKGAGVGK